MRSPRKGRLPVKEVEDKRPNTMIVCMLCSERKSVNGSKVFKAFKVCAECVKKLEQIDKQPPLC